MNSLLATILLLSPTFAALTVYDPSDTIDPAAWATDNALLTDFTIQEPEYQHISVVGPYFYTNDAVESLIHQTLENSDNDTSVLVVTEGANVTVDSTNIIKSGYSTSLLQASFYGTNAAVNVANGSTAWLNNVNVTTHNGAANVFSYGTGTTVYLDNVWSYSSGPVAHGFYASGNGTFQINNVKAYSGGTRSSIFSGDRPAGFVHVKDGVVHADGVGSSICYALGLCNVTNVIGLSSNGPAMFLDGVQTAVWTNCDLTAGLLGGFVIFSDPFVGKTAGTVVTLDNSRLTTLGKTMPALWFGNTVATVNIISSELNTASNILAVANYSLITQAFDNYGGYADDPTVQGADAQINIQDSTLTGNAVAYNGSSIAINLSNYSSWTGYAYSGYGEVQLGVTVDMTSNWTMTGNTTLYNFTNEDSTHSNIQSNGFHISYDAGSAANQGMNGQTFPLPGGGSLSPA